MPDRNWSLECKGRADNHFRALSATGVQPIRVISKDRFDCDTLCLTDACWSPLLSPSM